MTSSERNVKRRPSEMPAIDVSGSVELSLTNREIESEVSVGSEDMK